MTPSFKISSNSKVQHNLCFAVMVHRSPQRQWEEKKHLFTHWDKKNKYRCSTGQTPG